MRRRLSLSLAKTHDVCKAGEPKLTVVLLHGIASDSNSFKGLLKYLESVKSMRNIRFVTFDLLGSGKSESSEKLKYDFKDQLKALNNSIKKLKIKTPLVIVAHSMGTMITARYVSSHKKVAKELILVSPPIYREDEVKDPAFAEAMDDFRKLVAYRKGDVVKTKAFGNEIKYIVSNPKNYDYFRKICCPATIIYGELDKIIAPLNIPKLLKENSNICAIKTVGSHGVTPDKYNKIAKVLQKCLKEAENEAI